MSPVDSLLIDLAPDGPDALRCVAHRGHAADIGPVRWHGRHPIDAAAIDRERAALDDLRAAVVRRAADAGAIRSHGQLIFDLLLPAPIKAAIRGLAGGALIVSGLDGVPWPLLHDGRGFLGLRFALGELRAGERWPVGAPETPDRWMVLADPAGDLPAARAEGEALAAQLAGADRAPAYDIRLGRLGRAELLRALRRYRVVHFAGHVDPAERGDGWRLADGHLDPRSIALLAGGPVPRLVLANACCSLGPAGAALVDAGVRHVVGTDLDLPDLQGADLVREIHRALLDGRPVGDALRLARRRAADRHDPAWMAYRLWGDPRTRFAAPSTVHRAELRRAVAVAIRRPMPEALDARVDAIRRWRRTIEATLAPAGGQLLPPSGQICRVVFGVPTRREDDARRAAAAALKLAARCPEAVIALDAGRLAVTGDALIGGPLDEAEALCWGRGPGVYLGETAARTLRGIARLDAGGQRLLSIEARPRPVGPFIGRGDELDAIERLAERLADSGGAALTIIGPAGIGKSRLLAAADGRLASRCRVVRVEADGGGPFGGVEQMVRTLCGLEPDDAPALARRRIADGLDQRGPAEEFLSIDDLLGDREQDGPTLDDETRRRHAETLSAMLGLGSSAPELDGTPAAVVPAIRALIRATAEERPLALIVEDLHVAPRPAVAVVEALVDDPPPALLIATTRPGGPLAERAAGPRHHRLELAPLPPVAARALLTALRPDTDDADGLLDRAEGNPLFIHELARHRGLSPSEDGLPESIEALMQARLDRLCTDDRQILRAAAVLGRTFWQDGVARLLGRPDVGPDLDRLAAERFVTRELRSALPDQVQWRFEHGLMHDTVDRSLPRRARAALHGRAALWLADELPAPAGPRAARVARHREAAGDLPRAVADWLAAADHAEATLAPDAARRAIEAALAAQDRITPPVPRSERADVLARLAHLDLRDGTFDRAADRFTAALGDTAPGPARARRLARLSAVELARGDTPAARRAVDDALAQIEAHAVDPGIRAEVIYQAAWTDYHQGALDQAQARLEALLAELPPDAEHGRGMAWRLMGTIAQQRGDAEAASAWLKRALAALHDDVEQARVLHGLALVAVQRGEYAAAAAHYAHTVRIRARLGDRAGLARTYSNLGTLCGERGDFPRAERYLREAIRIRRQLGHGSLAISHANLVELYLRQGRPDAARAELDQVTALLDAGRAPGWARSELWRITADVRLRHGEIDAAEIGAGHAIRIAREMHDPLREASAFEVQARIHAARGQLAAATEAYQAAIDLYEELEATGDLARALDQLAELVEASDPPRAARLRRERAQVQSLDA